MSEEWLNINGYSMYCVSNLGRIFNREKNRLVRPYRNHRFHPYQVTLSSNGHSVTRYVHRLVAAEFFKDFEWDRPIEFIDGDNTNACVHNLKYVSDIGVPQLNTGFTDLVTRWFVTEDAKTGEVRYYHSAKEVAEALDRTVDGVYRALRMEYQTIRGQLVFIEYYPTILVDDVPVISFDDCKVFSEQF